MTIIFYISSHGFGHASRIIEIIHAITAACPGNRVVVRTMTAQWLFDLTARGPVEYHICETDTGIVQIDSLHLDVDASIRRAREFMSTFESRVATEVDFLERSHADLVVADLPPLGIAAGVAAGLPTVAVGNFSWDWIYSAYQGGEDVVAAIAKAYAGATVALRLPMWGGFDAFHQVIDLPFVARRSRREPDDTRRVLGLPANERLALVSFGGYGLAGLDLDALKQLDGYVAIVGGNVPLGNLPDGIRGDRQGSLLPFDEHAMYDAGVRYEDVIGAVDVVITKPGYGIIAECIANDTALLYTDRGHFVEYDVLVSEMPRYLRCAHIGHEDLFAGRWQPHLDALLAQPEPPEHPATNGAEVAAQLLCK